MEAGPGTDELALGLRDHALGTSWVGVSPSPGRYRDGICGAPIMRCRPSSIWPDALPSRLLAGLRSCRRELSTFATFISRSLSSDVICCRYRQTGSRFSSTRTVYHCQLPLRFRCSAGYHILVISLRSNVRLDAIKTGSRRKSRCYSGDIVMFSYSTQPAYGHSHRPHDSGTDHDGGLITLDIKDMEVRPCA